MKPVLLLALLASMLSVFVLVGCESPAAQRERARADRIRAEAQSYERAKQADAAYNTQVTLNRQYERDASHERTMESLPFVLAIGGGLLILTLTLIGAGLVWQHLQVEKAKPQTQPRTALTIHDESRALAQRVDRMERGFYGLIIALQRNCPPATKESWPHEMPIMNREKQPWA